MPNLSARVIVEVQGTLSNPLDMGDAGFPINEKYANVFTNGAGLNQASDIFPDRRALAGGANENLDLFGSLTNPLGTTISAAKLKGIILRALSTNTGDLTITRPAANGVPFLLAASNGFTLVPNGLFLLTNPSANGFGIVTGTADLINVANATGAIQTYDVILIVA